jgi:hypothetical protein
MSKIILILLVLFNTSGETFSQTIPSFTGLSAEDKKINIPESSKGKYALICFASSKKAQADLESWLNPVYNRYIAKTGFMDDMFDVDVFFVPVFSGAEGTMEATIKKRFRETAQKDVWPHLIFADKGLKEILAPLKMTNESVPYFFFLDKTGKITYQTSGAFSEEKFDAIDELVVE